jgi:endoglucanase
MKGDRMERRAFLKSIAGAAIATAAGGKAASAMGNKPVEKIQEVRKKAQYVFPRWRGFNLQYLMSARRETEPDEEDFRWISGWGFNFVRLPMNYRAWTEEDDVYKPKPEALAKVDKVIDWGKKYGIHICLNFHRAPGYCVNRNDLEPYDLFKDAEPLNAFCHHWELFSNRYKSISSGDLSFNLLNEPTAEGSDYVRVAKAATAKIRSISPDRIIISDGLKPHFTVVDELAALDIGQSCRGYSPGQISHYKAGWAKGADKYPMPIWPDPDGKTHGWDRKRLEEHYAPWAAIARSGVGVHCGECGCYTKTPHKVFLAWFRDVLEILTSHNIGYALWNMKGAFGIVDTGREDAEYEDFHGHKLDKKLFDLLMEF